MGEPFLGEEGGGGGGGGGGADGEAEAIFVKWVTFM